jgi:DNA-binding response OmpR family regulator
MRKILLADDDASVSQMLGNLLELEHYQVLRARTGRETVAMFRAEAPDLVLLDLKMPDYNGWELFETMQRIEPAVPVIIITALSQQQARATRASVLLMEKPLDMLFLLENIQSCLAVHREEEQPLYTHETEVDKSPAEINAIR